MRAHTFSVPSLPSFVNINGASGAERTVKEKVQVIGLNTVQTNSLYGTEARELNVHVILG